MRSRCRSFGLGLLARRGQAAAAHTMTPPSWPASRLSSSRLRHCPRHMTMLRLLAVWRRWKGPPSRGPPSRASLLHFRQSRIPTRSAPSPGCRRSLMESSRRPASRRSTVRQSPAAATSSYPAARRPVHRRPSPNFRARWQGLPSPTISFPLAARHGSPTWACVACLSCAWMPIGTISRRPRAGPITGRRWMRS